MFVRVLLPQGTWFCISWWLFLALFVFRCAGRTVGGTKGWNALRGRHKIFPFTSYQYPSLTPAMGSHVVPATGRGELGMSCRGRSSLSCHLPRRSGSFSFHEFWGRLVFPLFTACAQTEGCFVYYGISALRDYPWPQVNECRCEWVVKQPWETGQQVSRRFNHQEVKHLPLTMQANHPVPLCVHQCQML